MPIDFQSSDQVLGQTEYAKEMAKWNQPYTYQPYPRMLYRASSGGQDAAIETKTVPSESDERIAMGQGWVKGGPTAAREAKAQDGADRGTAAAERAYSDLRLSDKAQREAAVIEATTGGHVPEIPEVKRGPGRPRKDPDGAAD